MSSIHRYKTLHRITVTKTLYNLVEIYVENRFICSSSEINTIFQYYLFSVFKKMLLCKVHIFISYIIWCYEERYKFGLTEIWSWWEAKNPFWSRTAPQLIHSVSQQEQLIWSHTTSDWRGGEIISCLPAKHQVDSATNKKSIEIIAHILMLFEVVT